VPDKPLPDRPNLEQYKKQVKDLLRERARATASVLDRVARYHPRFHNQPPDVVRAAPFRLADAQLVIAREHGFKSWPAFAKHVEALRLTRELTSEEDAASAFIEAACVPRNGHRSGTLEEAEAILARYPAAGASGIYAAAILADEGTVRACLSRDPASATAKGGPRGWDALTYLCFSRYLRLDQARSDAFVRTARALLDAGASPTTGWIEMIDYPNPRPVIEAAINGAAAIAQHPELTRLLLERGADPNDEETPYHVIETRDNTVLKILLESGKLNARSMSTLLLRKCDWHDAEGLRLVLERGADPNWITGWGQGALHQAVRRDNSLKMIELLLDYGADPALPNREGKSAIVIAARRGRGDALDLFERRGTSIALTGIALTGIALTGVDALVAACARNRQEAIRSALAAEPQLKAELIAHGGTLLAEFSGVGNLAGVRNLLDMGVSPSALYREGDGYFGITKNSTALHVAAWRAYPEVVKELIAAGAPVNARDGQGRTALQLAVKACVDSYWTELRSPESIRALLAAGASKEGITLPTGYDEADKLLATGLAASTLHIVDGESVAGTLRQASIPGTVSIYGDLMFEGPAPAGLGDEAWNNARAPFLAAVRFSTLEEAHWYLKAYEDALAAFGRYDEVIIWLDHGLSRQLILIKVLDWFSRQNLGDVKLSLICIGSYTGLDRFVGLGQLTADQLESLVDTRLPVTEAQFRLARAAWNAFTSPDPTAIERLIATDTSALPFIAGAFRRHLEQFPSLDTGLSRTERQALSILHEQDSISGRRLFVLVQRMEEQIFMGDGSFYRMMADLSACRHPLVQVSGAPDAGLGTVTITDIGRSVIEGRSDHIGLNGIDRWLGGVHLKGGNAAWRWDRVFARLVPYSQS
jgi:ankyrin repeat protein